MSNHELRERIKHVIVDSLRLQHVTVDQIEDDTILFGEGLGLDSVDALELVVGLETEFGFKAADEEIGREHFTNVATLASWVASRTGGSAPATESRSSEALSPDE